jgi:hypothetical protein
MRQVSLEAMESLLVRYKGRYTAVVGFQPTGWSHTAGGGGGRAVGGQASRASSSVKGGKRLQRGTVVLYKVRPGSREKEETCSWHQICVCDNCCCLLAALWSRELCRF